MINISYFPYAKKHIFVCMKCPLCKQKETLFYKADKRRAFFICEDCGLIFVPPRFHLSPDEEKSRYEKHENNIENEGYKNFLQKIIKQIEKAAPYGASCLDFGCGPVPVLSEMLREKGFEVKEYDLFFKKDDSAFKSKYDVITASEVLEHLRNPLAETK
ncbi:MAG: methyltransferase domain-containing protein, partial [Fibrobacterota bacterium]